MKYWQTLGGAQDNQDFLSTCRKELIHTALDYQPKKGKRKSVDTESSSEPEVNPKRSKKANQAQSGPNEVVVPDDSDSAMEVSTKEISPETLEEKARQFVEKYHALEKKQAEHSKLKDYPKAEKYHLAQP